MNAKERTEVRAAIASGYLPKMYPCQAADCLKAAAKLMGAAWEYDAPDAYTVDPDLIVKALDIVEMVSRSMQCFRSKSHYVKSSSSV